MTQGIYKYIQYILIGLLLVATHNIFALGSDTENDKWIKPVTIGKNAFDGTKNSWWYGGQAKESFEDKDYESAILFFTYALKIDSNISEFYYYRGNSYALTKQPSLAFNDFQKALELNPEYLSALNNLGWEYFKRGEYRAALSYFNSYIKLIPKRPKLLFGVGFNTDYTKLLGSLAWKSLRENDLPRSIRYFTNYIKMAPNDPNAYLGLALIYYKYYDFEKAANYLNQAKEIKPILYKGFAGVRYLEKEGNVYTEQDKKLLMELFDRSSNRNDDFLKLTKSSFWGFLLSFINMFLGIGALIIFIVRFKKLEYYILYLALLNIGFGINFMNENALIKIAEIDSSPFWELSQPLIDAFIPILFILFVQYFIGWGWKRSILYVLIFSIIQGVLQIITEFTYPVQNFYGTSTTIFGFLLAVVLLLHLFLPEMRKNQEVKLISLGLGFFLISVLYGNLARMQLLPQDISFDTPAYLLFNLCLIYIAFKRISTSEKELVVVKQDLETARNIQNAILPEENPKSDFYEMSSAYLPMALIGGDYYDYQQQGDSHIGVLVADVSGHGISAALIASMLKVAFSAQVNHLKHPAELLKRINLSLEGQLNNEFITAGYFEIDMMDKKLTYSSAGHPPLVIYRRKDNELTELKVEGIPIGVFPEVSFNESSVQLIKGDRLVLYTDGVSDVFSPTGEAFGKNRFVDIIKETKNLEVEDAKQAILERLIQWSKKKENETYEDDITLIIFDVL